jgi:phosphocarrier protein HPr
VPEAVVTITDEVGLHARPAAVFSKAAAGMTSSVVVIKDGIEANAKSLLSLLKLDVRQGDTITVRVEGDDAAPALQELVRLLEER